MSKLRANRIGESDVGHDAFAEKRVHAMASAIEELIGDHEIEWLVLFFQRSDRGDRKDAFDAELLETVNVGAEIQLRGKNAMPTAMARQKRNFAAFERAQNIGVGRVTEWSLLLQLPARRLGRAWNKARCRR